MQPDGSKMFYMLKISSLALSYKIIKRTQSVATYLCINYNSNNKKNPLWFFVLYWLNPLYLNILKTSLKNILMLKVMVLLVVSVVFHDFSNFGQLLEKFGNDSICSFHGIRENILLHEKLTNFLYVRTNGVWLLFLLIYEILT